MYLRVFRMWMSFDRNRTLSLSGRMRIDHNAGDVKDDIPFQPDLEQQEDSLPGIRKKISKYKMYRKTCSLCTIAAVKTAFLLTSGMNGKIYESKRLSFHILDRVGGGDAFVSGSYIWTDADDYTPEDIVNFGVAASAVKHTIHGDGNITDDVSLIRHVMEMNFDIKR